MRLVVDASVALKFTIEEEDREQAAALISDDYQLLAPDFLLLEVSNAMWKKVRRREVGRDQAREAVGATRLFFAELLPSQPYFARAFEMAIDLDHPVYDCVYLAAAETTGTRLATADNRFARRLADTPYGALVRSIGGNGS